MAHRHSIGWCTDPNGFRFWFLSPMQSGLSFHMHLNSTCIHTHTHTVSAHSASCNMHIASTTKLRPHSSTSFLFGFAATSSSPSSSSSSSSFSYEFPPYLPCSEGGVWIQVQYAYDQIVIVSLHFDPYSIHRLLLILPTFTFHYILWNCCNQSHAECALYINPEWEYS